MRQILGLFFLLLIGACGDKTQSTITTKGYTTPKFTDTKMTEASLTVSNSFGFDTTYEISKNHEPFMVTGYFNEDNVLDTAILVRHKSTSKDALFIKQGGTNKTFLLKNGKDVGTDFPDYNWVGQFEVIKKGTKVWNNVIDDEIVCEDQVPDSEKFILNTDGIFVHVDEASGGGIIYFKKGKYAWVQQE
ncbi:MAG: hypothetical protein KGZ58_07030 [Ignavibacteriales bacterium]|nr:hypothetical protein [Ignavibacteriales bacterium]